MIAEPRNVVLIGAVLIIGATVHGGYLITELEAIDERTRLFQ
jgi:hypothetical protein